MRLVQLYIYPIKSGPAVQVGQAHALERGLAHDRRFMVTDAEGTVHVGGWAQADGTAGEALAILTLQRGDEAGEVSLTGAEVTTADGRAYAVTHDGSVISPPERPLAKVYLPSAAR